MPEGPTIVILKEEAAAFRGKKVLAVCGNSKLDIQRAKGQTVVEFKSWGKHFLICFKTFTIKIHFMLFGSYRINEERENRVPRLTLTFKNGMLNFYACSVKFLEGDLDKIYDWSGDVMSDQWDAKSARKKMKKQPELLACDALLDQNIFAGSGNIIKNEVLFRCGIQPQSRVGKIPARKLTEMINEGRNYSFDFLKWRKEYQLKKHLLVHNKTTCPNCGCKLNRKYLGKFNRRTFWCGHCQSLYR